MDIASDYLKLLTNDQSAFAVWLKQLLLDFPLAVEEFLKRSITLGVTSVEKVLQNRNRNKFAEMLATFLHDGLIKADVEDIRKSNLQQLQENLFLAIRFMHSKIRAKRLREDKFYGIPIEEFALVKRSF